MSEMLYPLLILYLVQVDSMNMSQILFLLLEMQSPNQSLVDCMNPMMMFVQMMQSVHDDATKTRQEDL